jgi:hypothetical protein
VLDEDHSTKTHICHSSTLRISPGHVGISTRRPTVLRNPLAEQYLIHWEIFRTACAAIFRDLCPLNLRNADRGFLVCLMNVGLSGGWTSFQSFNSVQSSCRAESPRGITSSVAGRLGSYLYLIIGSIPSEVDHPKFIQVCAHHVGKFCKRKLRESKFYLMDIFRLATYLTSKLWTWGELAEKGELECDV